MPSVTSTRMLLRIGDCAGKSCLSAISAVSATLNKIRITGADDVLARRIVELDDATGDLHAAIEIRPVQWTSECSVASAFNRPRSLFNTSALCASDGKVEGRITPVAHCQTAGHRDCAATGLPASESMRTVSFAMLNAAVTLSTYMPVGATR